MIEVKDRRMERCKARKGSDEEGLSEEIKINGWHLFLAYELNVKF
jgi:hypothetical protein